MTATPATLAPAPASDPPALVTTYTVTAYERKTLRHVAGPSHVDTLPEAIRRASAFAHCLTTNRADVVDSHGRLVGYVDQGVWIAKGRAS